MTTLTSANGPSEVITARRTESLDAPSIHKLQQQATESLFGRVNVVNLIEKAVLAVTLSNEKEEILGHAAFFDYPNVEHVDPAEWEKWISTTYGLKQCNALNTLFLHYFVAKPEYSHGCAAEIIRTMFNAVPELHYCLLVVPTGVFPDSALVENFSEVPRSEDTKLPLEGVLFSCSRHRHVPVLHVRAAMVEDTDDLVPIFNRQSDMLKRTYGDYFLAELIEAQDDHLKCIVAEVAGTAVGFMSICDEVNVNLLNQCYELGPFHGLCKEHPDDIIKAQSTPDPSPPDQERPTSGESHQSGVSKASSNKSSGIASDGGGGSGTDGGGTGSPTNNKTPEAEKSQSKANSKPNSKSNSRANSRPGSGSKIDDVKTKSKLSDTMLGASAHGSLISDHSDMESVKSEASGRNFSTAQVTENPSMAAPGTASKQMSSITELPKRFVPTYHGASNAVAIQLFCIDEKFEMRSTDFLTKVFELFPEFENAILTVPHLVPEFPLLQQFVRITPRVPSTMPQELYVFNRAGLIRQFVVRKACTSDFQQVENLVKTLELNQNLLADLSQFNKARRDRDGTEIQCFVAECNRQIVGISIIRREEDIEYIRSHYNIEDFVYFNHHKRDEHGHLHHFALNPIFKHYSKHFLKEILRLGHKTCLHYPLYPPYVDKVIIEKHTLVGALNEMVPVRARRQIEYPLDKLGGNAPGTRIVQKQEQYALNHINRKLTLEPKVTINARIIVIGASDVGIAFLESFAFCPHLRFNNLMLISPHGLPGELPPDELREQVLGSSHCYSQDDYAQMALRAWVNVVYGKMTGIDRKKKHVIVDNGLIVPYDHLVIATGLQYQTPTPSDADVEQLATSSELPISPDSRYVGEEMKNVFVINDQYDAAVVLYWLENNTDSTTDKVLVYGHTLDTYCFVQSLISLGIAATRIILIEPPLNYETTCFNNHDVELAVAGWLKKAGVEVHSGFLLAQFNDGHAGQEVFSAAFTSNTKPIRVECKAFFSFYKKMVDFDAFQACNNACLVFDGRLVIDSNFHTNDVSIRAAGPITKFQRLYHAEEWTHANFNSKEIGIQLASAMLSLFDPTLEPEPEAPVDLLKLIPMYRSPKVQAGFLPGGFFYLDISKPSLKIPLEVAKKHTDYGRELTTGIAGGGQPGHDFFRLHLNHFSTIETITCLSKKPICWSNIMCLYGTHERYLNNMCQRFDEGLISDLFKFFTETWCLAIFHDRFFYFRDEVRELLISSPSPDVASMEEKVRKMIDDDLHLSKDQRKCLQQDYTNLGFKRAVETRLLSFLSYSYYHLPMYAKPGMV